tara:strand:- start:942 stop:1355 length:414 start_codon:yes stop_codon:yes gene_type:complete
MTVKFILCLALAFAALLQQAQAQTITGEAGRVVDGDTFHLGAIRIRICGIDAPERGELGYSEARMALAQIISGRRLRCIPVGAGSVCDGRSGAISHKRIVAQCFVGDADIAASMVRSGYACDWVRFSGGAYQGGCRK